MFADQSPADRRRAYRGPAILQQGFRPFFLGAGAWTVIAMALWLGIYLGYLALPSRFDPLAWHSHEMLFGFVGAAIAGFLLTAVPNWTGRLPVRGWPLALLFSLWVAGRLAVGLSEVIGAAAAALIDVAFLVALDGVLLREILAGRNWRNLPVVVIVALLAGCNILIHLEDLTNAETASGGLRLALATVVMLIALIGGRIVPSFTRNWLKKRNEARLPRPFGPLDRAVLLATLVAGLCWTAWPDSAVTGLLCLLAGLGNGWRLARWRGHRTLCEPLVWVLHLGYGWVALGLAVLGLSIWFPDLLPSAPIHALTAGAMGTMTLAVMTRATLGHTGQALSAGFGTTAIYLLVTAAALLRILSSIIEAGSSLALTLGALCWVGAFGLFVALYAPLLMARRRP
ncbi:MAG: NnrS family protein [Kiloniellales bacterium]|nr:NnrS family protein [Kiloniellales bacterium]